MPDQGASAFDPKQNRNFRRAIIAGLLTSPGGVLGAPTVSKPTLG